MKLGTDRHVGIRADEPLDARHQAGTTCFRGAVRGWCCSLVLWKADLDTVKLLCHGLHSGSVAHCWTGGHCGTR